MELAPDLSPRALADAMPGRPIRTYPALLSTEADAIGWARGGGAEGSLVVADYQASPRGRAGWPWEVAQGRGLGFSLVLRPQLPPEREGWIYTVAVSGLADVLEGDAKIEWPDEVRGDGRRLGAVGVHVELGPHATSWAVVNALVSEALPPRAPLLARLVAAIEARHRSSPGPVLADYTPRCRTIGRSVRARLIPLGPSGPEVTGRAVRSLEDGALVLETKGGSAVAVRPQNLALLEDAPPSGAGSSEIQPTSSG